MNPKPQDIDLHDSVAGEEDPGASLDMEPEGRPSEAKPEAPEPRRPVRTDKKPRPSGADRPAPDEPRR